MRDAVVVDAGSLCHIRAGSVLDEYAKLALDIIDSAMLNGKTIRLDGAILMAPR